MATFDERVAELVREELTAIDVEASFDDMLDECYSFDSVGGPFAWMTPSRVLREMDPTAHRCGVADHADGQGWTEIGGDYYDTNEVDAIKERVDEEMDAEGNDE